MHDFFAGRMKERMRGKAEILDGPDVFSTALIATKYEY
jgi:hypothetical protein